MKELVEQIVRILVDFPNEVDIREIKGPHINILEIYVSKEDVAKLIGKKGKNISALKRIVSAAGKGKRYMVDYVGQGRWDRQGIFGGRQEGHSRNCNLKDP